MVWILFLSYVILVMVGLFFHRIYDSRPYNGRYIDLGQFYIDILIPLVFGSMGFLIVLEILEYPGVDLFVSDTVLFFALAVSACMSFLGCGMHVIGKLLSKVIDEGHPAYRLNRFYHIYVAHMTGYLGFMFFAMFLSILALKHPQEEISVGMKVFYLMLGAMFGYFTIKVTSKPRELIRVFWPLKSLLIFVYLLIVLPHFDLMERSPVSFFLGSFLATTFVLYSCTVIPLIMRKVKKRNVLSFSKNL
ncbi:hypothetical protein HYU11_05785 [Candidatus Woesearchaeota archaeon]|nr:hypothetical protein [Candidatus Woesearchaeota archaeon]